MAEPETIDHKVEGATIFELKKVGDVLEVWVDGKRRLSSAERGNADSFVDLALAPLRDRDDITVVLAGLGIGFTLQKLLLHPGVKRVDVVERSPTVAAWGKAHFAALTGNAIVDPRVHVHEVGINEFVKAPRQAGMPQEGWLAIVLDTDRGPTELFYSDNASLYTDEGLLHIESALRSGGVFATWTNGRDLPLMERMNGPYQNVAEVCIPVEVGDKMELQYVYRGRRPAQADPNKPKN